ncbi:DUF1413 domain-containing protein [Clostridium sp. AF32-12BH]|uniref:DUF1413 domain-containing protein n=1 Tax=Clostridium sp. AF32-12BH TaxID=2292006 RepID=UPI000E4ED0F9|nr:DUF1413 domain-containing protein [Clostridium sp. AF32-12BH]RHP49186.1 DUF1413 domain-containing protein [Clostridium sp. AF32-12BH]
MSKTIKITVSDDNYDDLVRRAGANSLQDFIRSILFPGQITITPPDAVQRALQKYKKGELFSVPEIYGEDWNLPNGMAGQFGRKFFNLVTEEYQTKIRFTGNYNSKKHAVYKIL